MDTDVVKKALLHPGDIKTSTANHPFKVRPPENLLSVDFWREKDEKSVLALVQVKSY